MPPIRSAELAQKIGLRGDGRSRILLLVLAQCIYDARLENNMRVLDASDMKEWLLELAAWCLCPALPSNALPAMAAPENAAPENSGIAGQIFTFPLLHATCPGCGHLHEGDGECGSYIGSGKFCRCEKEVVQ